MRRPAAILVLLAALLFAASPAVAHRLDEYLQGALVSIDKNRVAVQITLTPGVAVLATVLAEIDTNKDSAISGIEQQAYAERVLRDLSLKIDDQVLTPHLLSVEFPSIEAMKDGRGGIRIEFDAVLPGGGTHRKLLFENHHLSRIAAYQVNCLVPKDRDIRIVAQNRNYSQSRYELEYAQPGVQAGLLSLAASPVAPLLGASLLGWWLWQRRGLLSPSTARR